MSQWLSMTEAADALGVSQRTVRRMIAHDELEAQRVRSKLIRVSAASVAKIGRPLNTSTLATATAVAA